MELVKRALDLIGEVLQKGLQGPVGLMLIKPLELCGVMGTKMKDPLISLACTKCLSLKGAPRASWVGTRALVLLRSGICVACLGAQIVQPPRG